jgi:hypothetical protein
MRVGPGTMAATRDAGWELGNAFGPTEAAAARERGGEWPSGAVETERACEAGGGCARVAGCGFLF